MHKILDAAVLSAAASAPMILPLGAPASPSVLAFVATAGAALLVWMLGARMLRHYDAGNGRSVRGDITITAVLVISVLAPLAAAHELFAVLPDPIWFAIVLVPGVACLRMVTKWLRSWQVRAPDDVVIVGVGALARHTGLEIRDAADNRRVLGYVSLDGEETPYHLPAPVLDEVSELESLLRKHVVSEVYFASSAYEQRDELQRAIRVCERFGIPFALPVSRFRLSRAEPREAKAVADGYIHYLCQRHKPVQLALKHLFDIAASGVALALLMPLFLVVAAAIKLTSKGPVLFKQVRVGQYGRPFHMLKFRSMVVNAEPLTAKLMAYNEQTGPVFKMARDPRITPIGRFIRKFSIDELPQLINVLRGEMSVVGPRPPLPAEVERYEAWQRRRLSVRPGLTCIWQVKGRNRIGFEEWMYLDMQYIDHWSLARDFRLILETIPVVLLGRGM